MGKERQTYISVKCAKDLAVLKDDGQDCGRVSDPLGSAVSLTQLAKRLKISGWWFPTHSFIHSGYNFKSLQCAIHQSYHNWLPNWCVDGWFKASLNGRETDLKGISGSPKGTWETRHGKESKESGRKD